MEPLLIGGLIGFTGSLLGAAVTGIVTTRQARLVRERDARQKVMRLLSKIRTALDKGVRQFKPGVSEEELEQYTDELDAAILDFRRSRDRRDLEVCVEAIRERHQMGPNPSREARSATYAIYAIVKARASSKKRPKWVAGAVKGLSDMLDIEYDNRERPTVLSSKSARSRSTNVGRVRRASSVSPEPF